MTGAEGVSIVTANDSGFVKITCGVNVPQSALWTGVRLQVRPK